MRLDHVSVGKTMLVTGEGTRSMEEESLLEGGGRTRVSRRGSVLFRASGPWSHTVISLLQHLERSGFSEAPHVIGQGFDEHGRETLSFIEGDVLHPQPWADDAVPRLGEMLRRLHDATSSFSVPKGAVWRPWFGRTIGRGPLVIGHCDTGPWNIISRAGLPIALIDWEVAGPVRQDIELVQACWLNAQLYDDDIAEKVGLGPATARARQVRMLLDGYGLARNARSGFVDQLIEFAVLDAAAQAIESSVTAESTDPEPLWAITWRTKSAAWILRNRHMLEAILV
ncbi:aminoglycoside phosphotransferase family protein [Rhizobium leguminosarum]|uniref:aminoglycoside phosphotransferase family protein n=1 Tax=Rhizobium TaxID=379 RepID=UPI0032B1B946